MKSILKTFLVWVLIYILTPFSSAYKSEDMISINFEHTANWSNVYNVPAGKDLIINKFYANDLNSELYIRDNWWDILAYWEFNTDIYQVNIVIKDILEVKTWRFDDNFNIFWYLVNEDESIENYIEWNSNAWNKHIFNKTDIEFIYRWEFVIFFIFTAIKFFSIIVGRKINIF